MSPLFTALEFLLTVSSLLNLTSPRRTEDDVLSTFAAGVKDGVRGLLVLDEVEDAVLALDDEVEVDLRDVDEEDGFERLLVEDFEVDVLERLEEVREADDLEEDFLGGMV